ncbi:hypothetical protein ACFL5H_03320 [Candidatus Latescibacterota bacterium]
MNLEKIINSSKRFLRTSLLVSAFTVNPFLTDNVQSQDLESKVAAVSAENAPELEWDKTFGGFEPDWASSVQQTFDGGYILAGYTKSFGAGSSDFWLIKTDSNGNMEWDKTFGGSELDWASSVQQTSDGGYILTGSTQSFGSGASDIWLIKTDQNGYLVWDETFGGPGYDFASSVQQTSDDGYIIAGWTYSYGAGYNDSCDFWLIKTDSNGSHEWNKTIGGSKIDFASSVQQTFDGGYILAGSAQSFGAGSSDCWLVKTDPNGDKEWDKTFGGAEPDEASSVQQTFDGGYILAGYTKSFGAGYNDFWLIKTDPNGNKEWDKTFGRAGEEQAYSVQQTSDGGYIVAGWTYSIGAGFNDFWLIKTDQNGNKEWDNTFGGIRYDFASSVQQTSDGGYIIAGGTQSFGAGSSDYGAGSSDTWLIKTDSNGNRE